MTTVRSSAASTTLLSSARVSSWVRQAERDQCKLPGTTTYDRERIKALERAVRELRQADSQPETAPPRVQRDVELKQEIRRVFDENFQVYGVRRVWRQLRREGFDVARCRVARLMKKMALQGVIRGKRVRTTVADTAAPCPLDHVNRQFKAPRPNVLWVSDFTYVATWVGFVYVAFVIDAYVRRIVG